MKGLTAGTKSAEKLLQLPKARPSKPRQSLRNIMDAACADARDVLAGDPQLRRICAEYAKAYTFEAEDNEPDVLTGLMYDADEVAGQVVLHALRRQGLRWLQVSVSYIPNSGRPTIAISLKHRGREARRLVEIPL